MSGQYCVDANVFLSTWYVHYPPRIFAPLWEQISQCWKDIVIIKPIFDEIEPISSSDLKLPDEKKKEKYPLRVWLVKSNFFVPVISDDVNTLSLELESEYETTIDSKGAGPTDIVLISYAEIMDKTVVTFEGKQHQKPRKKCNYKIPLICSEQGVSCINFITMLDRLDVKI